MWMRGSLPEVCLPTTLELWLLPSRLFRCSVPWIRGFLNQAHPDGSRAMTSRAPGDGYNQFTCIINCVVHSRRLCQWSNRCISISQRTQDVTLSKSENVVFFISFLFFVFSLSSCFFFSVVFLLFFIHFFCGFSFFTDDTEHWKFSFIGFLLTTKLKLLLLCTFTYLHICKIKKTRHVGPSICPHVHSLKHYTDLNQSWSSVLLGYGDPEDLRISQYS